MPQSGALPQTHLKGDVRGKWSKDLSLIIDHKSTKGKKSVSINRADIEKLMGLEEGSVSMITFNYFGDKEMYGILPLSQLLTLLEAADEEALDKCW